MNNESIINKMTLAEKALMMSGATTWKTVALDAHGIPSLFLSDGPTGLRKQVGEADHLGLNASHPATCYPTAATIANSWDEALVEELGEHLGAEARELEVDVVLGPGLNVKRSPLGGRNFEYFSEDPYLSGKMAAGFTRGIQSNGVAACPKHFAANSQELRRMANDSVLDERTLREIYLTGFEIAVKEAKPKSIMSAYNKVNGVFANENAHLLQEILVDEWGFDGFVVSDWGGSNDHAKGVQNGSHLEMPSTGLAGAQELIEAVHAGRLDEAILNQRVDELLTTVFAIEQGKKNSPSKNQTAEEHHQFAKKAAAESIVLLKNEEQILPLDIKKTIGVIGDFAETPRYQGAGSSLVNPTKLETSMEILSEYPLSVKGFAKGYHRIGKHDEQLIEEAVALAKTVDQVLLYIGLTEISEVEGLDRDHMQLPNNQQVLLDAIAAVNQNIIVVLSGGSAIVTPWIHKVKALVHGYLGGQAGAGAMLDVLTGKVNPSGKLNESYPMQYEDTPAYNYYPGTEKTAEYREGIFVGYRYYETNQLDVRFPFGYGLSYTTFDYANLQVANNQVSFEITNTGSVAGAEIAQLYVGMQNSQIYRAAKELKGFKKVFLAPGETKQVIIPFDEMTFRYFDSEQNKWQTEAGTYQLMIGSNVSMIHLTTDLEVSGVILAGTKKEVLPSYFHGDVRNVSDDEFELLLGHAIPDHKWNKIADLEENDTLSQMYYAKSGLARLVYKVLTRMKDKSIEKGKPDLNILFNYNMPFRAIGKMTGGAVNQQMVSGILLIVNSHFFKGVNTVLKGFSANRKLKKQKEFQ